MQSLFKLWQQIRSFSFLKSGQKQDFINGIGQSSIREDRIIIDHYPFKPSTAYLNKDIFPAEIESVCWESFPPMIRIKDDLIFIDRENKDSLQAFAQAHQLPSFKPSHNWEFLLEPFLDTVYTEKTDLRLGAMLMKNGIDQSEIDHLRKEVGPAMHSYNFDSMLWEWVSLGLPDVLFAMKAKLSKQDFEIFYWKAMHIELRGSSSTE